MFDDLRHSLRALAKHPSFLVAGVVVLGLAVGVNTAVFSLINAFLLRPLPVHAPQELGYVAHFGCDADHSTAGRARGHTGRTGGSQRGDAQHI